MGSEVKRNPLVVSGLTQETEHGLSRYRSKKYRCRCEVCRKANSEEFARERANRAERIRQDPSLRPHGIRNTFHNWDCRCDVCCDAMGVPRGTPPRSGNEGRPRRMIAPMPRRSKGQDPRRAALLYKPGAGSLWKNIEPFGREWLE